MSKFVWTLDWLERRPSLSADERWRRTLVLPLPWTRRHDPVLDEPYWRALVVVVAPWWLSRETLDPEVRKFAKHERRFADWPDLEEDEQAWEDHYDQYIASRPPWPSRWPS